MGDHSALLGREDAGDHAEKCGLSGAVSADPPDTTLLVEHLRKRWTVRADEIQLVTGHFPLCTTELLGGGFTTFTVLREPIERILSALRQQSQRPGPLAGAPLESVYDEPVRNQLIRNHMVKMLSITTDEMDAGALTHVDFTHDRLEREAGAGHGRRGRFPGRLRVVLRGAVGSLRLGPRPCRGTGAGPVILSTMPSSLDSARRTCSTSSCTTTHADCSGDPSEHDGDLARRVDRRGEHPGLEGVPRRSHRRVDTGPVEEQVVEEQRVAGSESKAFDAPFARGRPPRSSAPPTSRRRPRRCRSRPHRRAAAERRRGWAHRRQQWESESHKFTDRMSRPRKAPS